ncbi:MAG: alginate lyase family protein [Candidatus Hydrogenedentota bacterium]
MLTAMLIAFSAATLETTQDVCREEPERVAYLFAHLDLAHPGLGAVAAAAGEEDWPGACTALLTYYREERLPVYRARHGSPQAGSHSQKADLFLDDTFVYFGKEGAVPRLPHGGWDWDDLGPENDREWAWGMNRHFHLRILLNAYHATGEQKYLDFMEGLLQDWIITSGYPGEKTRGARWRGLETALRMRSWPQIFYELLEDTGFSDATRILMLSRLPQHAHYLRHFHGSGNWATMEMNGLATIAVAWPEFKRAETWAAYAAEVITREQEEQVYPDGVQKELSSHYHQVALRNFQAIGTLFEGTPYSLPGRFRPTLEKMWAYLAYSMRPDGYGVMNNDSDRDHTAPQVLRQAGSCERPDWAYIATNGAQGAVPDRGPSVVFPWAGQAIFRSGWDTGARWCFFDFGPFGTGHQHHDKLHISIHAHGRDLLVDSGRYTYVGGPWRCFFVGTRAHNTLLIDGCEQDRDQLETDEPADGQYTITEAYDCARGTFDAGYAGLDGGATHTRALVYVKDSPVGDYYVAVDRVASDRPRTITALWHLAPDCTPAMDGVRLRTTDDGKGNLALTPSSGMPWEVRVATGEEDPIQGWYSLGYYKKTPAPTLVYTAELPEKEMVFAWVVRTGKGEVTPPKAVQCVAEGAGATVTIAWAEETQTLQIPLEGAPEVVQ